MRCKHLLPELIILILAGVTGLAFGTRSKASLDQVGNQVECLCGGCVAMLNHCPHLPSQCESRAEITAIILKDIKEGKSDPEILHDLSARFGVQVLAAPPARGFDLAAWILPGVGLAIGLAVVILIVLRMRRPSPPEAPGQPPVDPKIIAAVEEEMNRTVPLTK
jgi:hypothetical protein